MTALLKEAKALKPSARVQLVNKLIAIDLAEHAESVETAEMVRRIEDVKRGRVKLVDASDMIQAARKIAGMPAIVRSKSLQHR